MKKVCRHILAMIIVVSMMPMPFNAAFAAETPKREEKFESLTVKRYLATGGVQAQFDVTDGAITSPLQVTFDRDRTGVGGTTRTTETTRGRMYVDQNGTNKYMRQEIIFEHTDEANSANNLPREHGRIETAFSASDANNIATTGAQRSVSFKMDFQMKNFNVNKVIYFQDQNWRSLQVALINDKKEIGFYSNPLKGDEITGYYVDSLVAVDGSFKTITEDKWYTLEIVVHKVEASNITIKTGTGASDIENAPIARYDAYLDGMKVVENEILGAWGADSFPYNSAPTTVQWIGGPMRWSSGLSVANNVVVDTSNPNTNGVRGLRLDCVFGTSKEDRTSGTDVYPGQTKAEWWIDNMYWYLPENSPAVTSITPTNGNNSVTPYLNSIDIAFNTAMDYTTLDTITFKNKGNVVPSTREYDKVNKIYKIKPSEELEGNETYEVAILANSVKSIGRYDISAQTVTFTTIHEEGAFGVTGVKYYKDNGNETKTEIFNVQGGDLIAEVAVENLSSRPEDVLLISAAYDAYNTLISVDYKEVTVLGKTTPTIELELNDMAADLAKIKVFAWNPNISPLLNVPYELGGVKLKDIEISAPLAVAEGQSAQVSVTGIMTDGTYNDLTGGMVGYSSNAESYVTISGTGLLQGVNDGIKANGEVEILDTLAQVTITATLDGVTVSKTVPINCGPFKLNPSVDVTLVRWKGDRSDSISGDISIHNSLATHNDSDAEQGSGYAWDRMGLVSFDLPRHISAADIEGAELTLTAKFNAQVGGADTSWPIYVFSSGDNIVASETAGQGTGWGNKPTLAFGDNLKANLSAQKPGYPVSVKDSSVYGTAAEANNCFIAAGDGLVGTADTKVKYNLTNYIINRLTDETNTNKKASISIVAETPEANESYKETTAASVKLTVMSMENGYMPNRPLLLITVY